MIEFAGVGVKYVDHDIEIVETDPVSALLAFKMDGEASSLLLDLYIDPVGYGFDLGGGTAFANDEKIRGSVFQAAKIQFKDVLSFYILDTIDDQFVKLFS